jgi:hypothetical protein
MRKGGRGVEVSVRGACDSYWINLQSGGITGLQKIDLA